MFPQLNNETLMRFYEIIISISGVLFPVFQAVLFFIIEKSFNRLEFSRQGLIKFYYKMGWIITLCLIYLLIQPILQIIKYESVSVWFLNIFSLLIIITRLNLLVYTGEYNSIYSSRSIPEKLNFLLKFLVTINNNTFLEKLKFIIFILIILTPNFVSYSIFWSTFTILLYTLFQISILLNNPTFIQRQLLKSENTNHELIDDSIKWSKQKIESEFRIILKTLNTNGYNTQKSLKNDKFNLGLPQITQTQL